jgi:hypothetical protein
MHILLLFVYREDLVDEVLEALVELELVDACVLRGTAMERILSEDVPIFAGLLQTLGDSHDKITLVMAPLPDRTLVTPLFRLLADNGADFADATVGRLCLVPAEFPEPPSAS